MTRAMVVLAAVAGVAFGSAPRAQNVPAPLRFEVASVKRNTSGDQPPRNLTVVPGGVRVTNLPLSTILSLVHRVQSDQVVDVPAWARTESFDINGKAPAGVTVTVDVMAAMMRDLLAERFQLKTRRETRELAVYALVPLEPGAPLGPRMTQAAIDCSTSAPTAPPTPPAPDTPRMCGGTGRPGSVSVHGLPLNAFTRLVGPMAGRVVVDRTGLSGPWNIELEFASDTAANPPADVPSLFTAVREQLGLKLESARAPVEVIVIERLERPSPD
jgi:uncharacterized protein (TIGR03435 family)